MKVMPWKSYVWEKWQIDVRFDKEITLDTNKLGQCVGFTLCAKDRDTGKATIEQISECDANEIVDTLIKNYNAEPEYDMWGNRVPMFRNQSDAEAAVKYIEEILVAAQILESAGLLGEKDSA